MVLANFAKLEVVPLVNFAKLEVVPLVNFAKLWVVPLVSFAKCTGPLARFTFADFARTGLETALVATMAFLAAVIFPIKDFF